MKNKKLSIVLIAISCVALIAGGVAFAWFLLSPEGSGNSNGLANATTKEYGNIKFEGLETFESENIYPGVTNVQTFKISKGSKEGTGTYSLTLTGNVNGAFKHDVEATLYKSTDSSKYVDDDGNVVGGLTPVFEGILKPGTQIVEEVAFDTDTLEDTMYYVVYHYINREDVDQSAAMGKRYTGKIGVKLNRSVSVNECTYDGSLTYGSEYVNGQYTYKYSYSGWRVTLTDKESTDPVTTKLCTSINGRPIINMNNMFYNSKAESIDLSSFDTSNVTDMSWMFSGSKATSLDLSSFDTSKVTNMQSMFSGSKATSIDLSSFDTSKVTDMSTMFYGSQATSLDLSSFDTSNVTNMMNMFLNSKAESIDLSSFSTSKVTNMQSMFSGSKATSLDLSSFDTSNVTNMTLMFSENQATSLDLSSFNTSKVTNMQSMFSGSKATSIDLSSFDTSKVTDMSTMFYGSQATSLDLSSFDTSNVTNMSWMFVSALATTGYARNQMEADKFNNTSYKPSTLTFVVKPSS